jgi:CheY-like chemotaxis protein
MSETDASRHELEEIRRAGKQAAALTQQLLAFSRRQVLQPRVFDLNRVITDLEVMLRRLIGEDVLLAIRLGGSPLRLKADSAKIEQVIMNLVVNARDAMPHGGRLGIETVAVDLDEEYAFRHPEVTPGPYVLLAISDTGMGMSREVKAHLFEPFFTTKAKGQGTGLGLSTAYGVVMQSGGHIAVQSEEGHGTSFKIYLPRVTEEGAVEAAQEPVTSGAGRGTETVLVAEDEDGVRNLVSNMLRMRGYTVLEARNGLEALQIVERAQSRVDLVLTDVIMPNLSGRELADRLAVLQPDTPLIYMSGYTNETVVQHGILDSGRPFLQKPFSAATLTQLIRHVLDSGDQQAT